MRRVGLVLFFLALSHATAGGDDWRKLTSEHFELYTTEAQAPAEAVVNRLEQVRQTFLEILGSAANTRLPIRVLLFRDRRQFQEFAPRKTAAAFYFGTRARDYIVFSSQDRDIQRAAIHEYVHLLVRHTGLASPDWLNEGLAEVYSTLREHHGRILVGDVALDHLSLLKARRSIPLAELLSGDLATSQWSDENRTALFYARSWALTHMLLFSPEYRRGFPRLFSAMAAGEPASLALRRVYGKDLRVIELECQDYVLRPIFRAKLLDSKFDRASGRIQYSTPGGFEWRLVLADLMAQTNSGMRAAGNYYELLYRYPQRPEVHEGLGYLAWRGRDIPGANAHFASAVRLGSRNPEVYKFYAALRGASGAPDEEVMALLERSALLNPEDRALYRLIAYRSFAARDYRKSLKYLRRIQRVPPVEAYEHFRFLTLAAVESGNYAEAIRASKEVERHARGQSQTEDSRRLAAWTKARASGHSPDSLLAMGLQPPEASDLTATLAKPAQPSLF